MNLDISDFRVINSSLVRFSTAQLRISTTTLTFNMAAASELAYPQSVCLMAAEGFSGIAICSEYPAEFAPIALPFYNQEMGTRSSIRIKEREFVRSMRKTRNILGKETVKIPGVLYRSQNILYFDLTKATYGRNGTQRDRALEDYPTIYELRTRLRPAKLLGLMPASVDVGKGPNNENGISESIIME